MVYAALNSSNYARHDDVYDAVNSRIYTENSHVLCFIIPPPPPSNNAEQDNIYG